MDRPTEESAGQRPKGMTSLDRTGEAEHLFALRAKCSDKV